MKRNIILILLLMIMCCICFSGCFFLHGNSNNNIIISNSNTQKDSAKRIASEYVENKYGFTPTVLLVELGKDNVTGAGDAMVTMRYNGREFLVYVKDVDSAAAQPYCCDNYQKQDIEDAIAEYAAGVYGVKPARVIISDAYVLYPDGFHAEDMMLHNEYFHGDDALSILENQKGFECIIRFVGDVDLVQIAETEDDFFHREGIDILFTSHETETDMNTCYGKRYDYMYYETFDEYVYNCAMYMTGAVKYYHTSINEEIYEYKLSIGQCGNLYYLCTGKDVSEYTVSIAPDYLTADVINQSDWDGYAMLKDIGTEAIFVDGEFDEDNVFYLYCPKDKLPVVPASLPNHVVTLEHAFTEIKYNNNRFYQLNELNSGRNDVGAYAVFNSELTGNKDNSFRFMFLENIWN